MKNRIMDKHDEELFQKASGYPRIIGYWNKLAWDIETRKHKDNLKLSLSLIPLKNDGTPIFRERNDVEQFEIKLTLQQAKSLKNDLEKQIKKVCSQSSEQEGKE